MTINVRQAASVSSDIVTARKVLKDEAEALLTLADSLGDDFVRAVEAVSSVTGRIAVTGMGKSGHIGRKIAATLASTGCPSFFVHPAEASHGDLGMVTVEDGVIALSNSGETPELADIIAYCRRFGIPLIGITSVAGSALANNADITLVLPPAEEACTMGLAPTTSTTMMLALGDALAVALLERKGFSDADFKILHPGGQLGRRLLKVSDLMHKGEALPLVPREMSMAEAILVMTAKSLGCVGVVSPDGALDGIITDGDLRRHMQADLLKLKAGDVMTRGPQTVRSNLLAVEGARIMNTKSITSLFVVEDGVPVGVLHIHDCLRAGVV